MCAHHCIHDPAFCRKGAPGHTAASGAALCSAFAASQHLVGVEAPEQLNGMRFTNLVCLRYQCLGKQNLLLHWVDVAQPFGIKNAAAYHLGAACEMPFVNQGAYPRVAGNGPCCELEAHRTLVQKLLHKALSNVDMLPGFWSLKALARVNLLVSTFGSGDLRDFPESLLLDVLLALHARHGFLIELSYTREQMERGRAIEAKIKQRRGVKVIPPLVSTIGGYLNSVAKAHAVLFVETEAAHIAAALDIPSVVILGGRHYGHCGPWEKLARQM